MAILEMIASTFSIVYLMLILEVVFSSTKTIMYKQHAFEGRLIFFIYSLFVYYKKLHVGIFLWDLFLNQPIIQAYDLLNTFLTSFFGISIASDPWAIFLFLMPASFIYHFTNYWFQYGFGDNRIAKMVSFLAVAVFLSTGGFGLVHILSSPFLFMMSDVAKLGFTGMPWTLLVGLSLVFLPTADINTVITSGWGARAIADAPPMLVLFGVWVSVIAVAILILIIGRSMLSRLAEEDFSTKQGGMTLLLFPLAGVVVSLLIAFLSALLLYGTPGLAAGFAEVSGKFFQVSMLLLVLAGLAVIAEIIVFFALRAVMKNLKTGLGLEQ